MAFSIGGRKRITAEAASPPTVIETAERARSSLRQCQHATPSNKSTQQILIKVLNTLNCATHSDRAHKALTAQSDRRTRIAAKSSRCSMKPLMLLCIACSARAAGLLPWPPGHRQSHSRTADLTFASQRIGHRRNATSPPSPLRRASAPALQGQAPTSCKFTCGMRAPVPGSRVLYARAPIRCDAGRKRPAEPLLAASLTGASENTARFKGGGPKGRAWHRLFWVVGLWRSLSVAMQSIRSRVLYRVLFAPDARRDEAEELAER